MFDTTYYALYRNESYMLRTKPYLVQHATNYIVSIPHATCIYGLMIRRPAACQGHQGCVIWNNSLFKNCGSGFSAVRLCCYLLRKLKSEPDHRPQIPNSGSVTSPKIPLFSCLFSRPNKSEKRSQRLLRMTKFDSTIPYKQNR